MNSKKIIGTIVSIAGAILILISFFLKCYMFGLSNVDGGEHITIYAYTFNEEKTKEAVDEYFNNDIFVIAKEKVENLKAGDINALRANVYFSDHGYVENDQRSFLDRYYNIFIMAIGAIIVIIGINLLSEKIDED